MLGTDATLSALLVFVVLAGTIAFAGGVLVTRTRRIVTLNHRQGHRGREHELHWAAIRLRSNGHKGADLQEMLCTPTNCTPQQADDAIVRVGADV